MSRSNVTFLIVVAVILAGFAALSYRSLSQVTESGQWVTHTREVVGNLEALISTLSDAETGQRGYVITCEKAYLEPYDHAIKYLNERFNAFVTLTADNPMQQENARALRIVIDAKLLELKSVIDLRDSQGFTAAQKRVLDNEGKALMDDIRSRVAGMRAEEERLLAIRERRSDHSINNAHFSSIVATSVGLLLVGVAYMWMKRDLDLRNLRARELFEHREWLRVTLSSIGDALITTDRNGAITFVNPVAIKMMAVKEADILGKPLVGNFNIVNEVTRKQAENPITRVLREGVVVGLANHTCLIASDGTETPIEDSAAPIKNAEGDILGVVMVFHDVTERRRAELELQKSRDELEQRVVERTEELREREEHFRVLVQGVTDYAISRLDPEGRIIGWNSGAERITGYTTEEILGKSYAIFLTEEERAAGAFAESLKEARETTRSERESLHVCKNGSRIWTNMVISALHDEKKALRGYAAVTRDITLLKQSELERQKLLDDLAVAERDLRQSNLVLEQRVRERTTELEEANAKLRESTRLAEEANRAKDIFLATISHELRTPLTPIIGWSRLLKSDKFSDTERRHGIEVIERNAKMQAKLVEDLLDVSRIITGKLALTIVTLELCTVIEQSIETVRSIAALKKITIDTQFECHPLVSCDENRLKQVLLNLLNNAIKFSHAEGHISVSVTCAGASAEFSVSDNGEGIAPDALPHLFSRFWQVDGSSARKHGGMGLGLAIVKHLVQLQHGSVRARSGGAGKGSTFTVTLPILQRAPGTQSAEVKNYFDAPSASLSQLRVLVVEDDVDTRDLLTLMLNRAGATVDAVASVEDAERALKRARPDIILSDLSMPDEDGFSLVRKVRANSATRDLPIIALTAYAGEETQSRVLDAGFQAHISKPVDPAELSAHISRWTKRSSPSM